MKLYIYDLGGHYVDFNKYSPRFFGMNENKKTKDVCNKQDLGSQNNKL
jgi:hypothetical protein